MTTAVMEKKIGLILSELNMLKARVDLLVPSDNEGEYKTNFLKGLDSAKKSKARYQISKKGFKKLI